MKKELELSQGKEMALSLPVAKGYSRRTNQEWVCQLRGDRDAEHQYRAINALSQYLHVVAYNTLQKRQSHYSRLRSMDQESISELACDFVQDTLAKIAQNEFKLLNRYQGKGKFTSWAAQIINNEISSELRKVDWTRSTSLRNLSGRQWDNHNALSPEDIAISRYNHDSLHNMVAELPPKLCTALTRCILNEERAAAVAQDMGITVNAVYMLVHRAKQMLRSQLLEVGSDIPST